MKIALLEPLNVSEEMLREMAAPVLERGHELTVYDTKADSPQEVIRRAQGMDAVIIANTPFPAEAVTENPALKYIDVAFTGDLNNKHRHNIHATFLNPCNDEGHSILQQMNNIP